MRRVLALLAALSAGPSVAADSLGRLFLTPERRALLEQLRRAGSLDHAAAADARLRLDGAVTRSSGKRTVWINGRARHDDAFAAGGARHRPQQATLAAGDAEPVQVSVGGSMDRATRTQLDLVAPGAIRIERPRRAGD